MPDTLLRMNAISKRFYANVVLDKVDFALEAGQVNCLIGENGAGKSTLIKILSGAHQADSGEILLQGERLQDLTPKLARDKGIIPIYQELDLIDCMNVADNIFLGNEPHRGRLRIDRKAMREKTSELLEGLGISIDPLQKVGELSVALKQMVAIAKALSMQSRVLILDEPTDVLTGKELDILFETIRTIRAKGVGIIYISHRLEEIFEIGDVVTVLRDGNMVATLPVSQTDRQELIHHMAGREINEDIQPKHEDTTKPLKLEVRNFVQNGVLHDISLQLRAGEVLGLSGLIGAGRSELARAIIGADPIDSGELLIDGVPQRVHNPTKAAELGIGYVPEERKRDGLVLIQSIGNNVILPVLKKLCAAGFVQRKKASEMAGRYVKLLNVKCTGIGQQARYLSGGNQQKVVIAKWLAAQSSILILDEPTRGIDVGAKSEIYQIIEDLAAQGHAILLISSEMTELLRLSDRIIVLSEGYVTKTFDSNQVSQEELLEYSMPISLKTEAIS